MKYVIAFICLHLTFGALASEKGILIPEVTLISSEKNEQLSSNQSKFIFEIIGINDGQNNLLITYSIDDKNSTAKLNENNQFSLITSPGFHAFQFFYNDSYFEIYADSLEIKPKYISHYELRFQSSEFPVIVDKPVIYLYPEKHVDFTVQVKAKGKLSFTYPKYEDKWNGKASPNGELIIDGYPFNYLFWESNQFIKSGDFNSNFGFVVEGTNSTEFLEKQLSIFGFNSKEKADFITYWAPQLHQNEFNYIHFVLNEDANLFAELNIIPAPDHIYRLYILTSKIDNPNDYKQLRPQLIPVMDRNGFTVLEWGGSKIDLNIEQINLGKL